MFSKGKLLISSYTPKKTTWSRILKTKITYYKQLGNYIIWLYRCDGVRDGCRDDSDEQGCTQGHYHPPSYPIHINSCKLMIIFSIPHFVCHYILVCMVISFVCYASYEHKNNFITLSCINKHDIFHWGKGLSIAHYINAFEYCTI